MEAREQDYLRFLVPGILNHICDQKLKSRFPDVSRTLLYLIALIGSCILLVYVWRGRAAGLTQEIFDAHLSTIYLPRPSPCPTHAIDSSDPIFISASFRFPFFARTCFRPATCSYAGYGQVPTHTRNAGRRSSNVAIVAPGFASISFGSEVFWFGSSETRRMSSRAAIRHAGCCDLTASCTLNVERQTSPTNASASR